MAKSEKSWDYGTNGIFVFVCLLIRSFLIVVVVGAAVELLRAVVMEVMVVFPFVVPGMALVVGIFLRRFRLFFFFFFFSLFRLFHSSSYSSCLSLCIITHIGSKQKLMYNT